MVTRHTFQWHSNTTENRWLPPAWLRGRPTRDAYPTDCAREWCTYCFKTASGACTFRQVKVGQVYLGSSSRRSPRFSLTSTDSKKSQKKGWLTMNRINRLGVSRLKRPRYHGPNDDGRHYALAVADAMMDLLLAFSISISLILLILSVNVENPLQLSSFPSILLIGALWIGPQQHRHDSLKGDQGPDAVSRVIAAFADLVVGGNVVLGVIIFAILVALTLLSLRRVRGSEVAARFTGCHAGKQCMTGPNRRSD